MLRAQKNARMAANQARPFHHLRTGLDIAPSPTVRQLQVFTGDPAGEATPVRGNPCRVTLLQQPSERDPEPADMTQCYSWPLGERHAAVQCWNASGGAINCCGHGMLASAACWAQQWRGDGTLTMNGSQLTCHFDNQRIWLGFSAMQATTCAIPDWIEDILGVAPLACATAGEQRGYLVVELQADTCLTDITVPDASLGAHSQRALIVTCAVGTDRALQGENIHFRYFAPQYGVAEDAATGSAMRVLARYWRQRGLGDELQALQRSPEGGLLWSRVREQTTWVGGRVSFTDAAEEVAGV